MEDLGNCLPAAIKFDKRQVVVVVGTDGILFHIDSHHSGRRRDGKHVQMGLDVGSAAVLTHKVIEVEWGRPAEFCLRQART